MKATNRQKTEPPFTEDGVFIEKSIEKAKPADRRHDYFEDKGKGFGLRVESKAGGGRKSFFWCARVNKVVRFRALGTSPDTSVKDAREEAKDWTEKARDWRKKGFPEGFPSDPFAKPPKIEKVAPAPVEVVPTFQQLLDSYIEQHVKRELHNPIKSEAARILRDEKIQRAETDARLIAKKYFSTWLDRPIHTITDKDMRSVKTANAKHFYMANRLVQFVKALFNWSNETKFAPDIENPAKGVELDVKTEQDNARTTFLQPDELLRFNAALKDEPCQDLKDFLVLALSTGARRANLYAARWDCIRWSIQTWEVPYSKSGKFYSIQLLPVALEVLERRFAERAPDAVYVFPGPGRTGHLVNLNKHWNVFRERAKLPHIRLHDLRRTHASYQAIAGESLQKIGASLGHSPKSIQSTLIYARLHEDAVRESREHGQNKMLEMMEAAKKRQKKLGRKAVKMLPAKSA